MNKHLLTACLAALAVSTGARADAIPFFNVQFDATVVAAASDGTASFDAQSGVLGADPVSLSADSVGAVDIATAGAVIGNGLLTTSVDVSAGNTSNAVATAHFVGSFANSAPVSLSIDFSGVDFASGTGEASTTLFVNLSSNGVTLFSDYVHGLWTFAYTPVLGTTSLLDLTLSSDASAAFLRAGPGNASSVGIVTIAGAVPEGATWLLFAVGLGALGAYRRRRP